MVRANSSIIERKERWARKMRGKAKPATRSENRLPAVSTLRPDFPPSISGFVWTLTRKMATGGERAGRAFEELFLGGFQGATAVRRRKRFSVCHDLEQIEIVEPKLEVKHVLFTGYDGYGTNVRLEDCLDDDVLIATQFDGQPIAREHGGPARVIIPKLNAWKGAKFVRSIEFSSEDRTGFWEACGYSNRRIPSWKIVSHHR